MNIIPVLGMDPSFRHWGLSEAHLNLTTGELSTPNGSLIEPIELGGKQTRVNSDDLYKSTQLAEGVLLVARRNKIVFVELPVGSQSARAMASYGICIGIVGVLKAEGISVIEVTASNNKRVYTGNSHATKRDMINKTIEIYPDITYTNNSGKIVKIRDKPIDKMEHIADATASIHSGVLTPEFTALLKILRAI